LFVSFERTRYLADGGLRAGAPLRSAISPGMRGAHIAADLRGRVGRPSHSFGAR
jgi:hypothetical protein